MSDEQPCCGHTRVVRITEQIGSGETHEWWECVDCKTRFIPSPAVELERARLASLIGLVKTFADASADAMEGAPTCCFKVNEVDMNWAIESLRAVGVYYDPITGKGK